MSIKELKSIVKQAVQKFLDKDVELLQLKVYEPAVSHRIAVYLECLLKNDDLHFDCEYNKHFEKEKEDEHGHAIRPDILVHTRNTDYNNKIAIEIKKSGISRSDIEKLITLTVKKEAKVTYEYDLGVFIRFPAKKAQYKWFVDGKERQESDEIFQ